MSFTRSSIVAEARSWIGTPYRHQASLKGIGCDCLGLVRGVWRAAVGEEPERAPPYARDWAEASGDEAFARAARTHLIEIEPAQVLPGDVVLFRYAPRYPAKHAAIVTAPFSFGDDLAGKPVPIFPDHALMVHAHDGARVAEVAIAPWWRRRLAYAFRFRGMTD
jgi:NlpC/P60 family putative phage cell wall peptidase